MTTSLGPDREFDRAANRDKTRDATRLRAWSLAGLCLFLGLAAVTGVYWETIPQTVRVWSESETFNHCFLVVPICAYLVWRRWDLLSEQVPEPYPLGVVPLIGGALLWLVGDTAGVLFVEQVALVAMIQSLVLTFLGWRLVRLTLFPLFFLWFTVPVGTGLIPFFQYLTADMVVPLLRLSGIPVFLEGLYFYIPSGSFEVAEACSGVRYLISSVALGCLASNLLFESTWRRVVFVALSFAVPILANGLRAYGIVMIAHLSEYEYAVGADHLIYGWIFFSVVTLCLLGVGAAMRDSEDDGALEVSAVTRGPRSTARPTTSVLLLAVIVCVVLSGALYQSFLQSRFADQSAEPADFGLTVSPPWAASTVEDSDRRVEPDFPGATAEVAERFRSADGTVDLYVAYFANQHQGAEVINEANEPVGGAAQWRVMASDRRVVQVDGAELAVNQVVVRSTETSRLVWNWYWVDHRFTSDRYLAKLWEVKSKLLSGRGEAAFVAVSTPLEASVEESVERMTNFLRHTGGLDAALVQFATDPSN